MPKLLVFALACSESPGMCFGSGLSPLEVQMPQEFRETRDTAIAIASDDALRLRAVGEVAGAGGHHADSTD